jgi:CheY-like chemotaxis protein
MAVDNGTRHGGRYCQPKLPREIVLLVDDNEDDQLLVRQAFSQAKVRFSLYVVSSGEEAIAYLRGDGPFANRKDFPVPGLVLLDLKMPRKSGFEVLEWIRAQPELRGLRVVVLTASEAVWDVKRAYDLGASSFLVKPVDFQEFKAMCEALQSYWMGMNMAPGSVSPAPLQEGRPETGEGKKS